MEAVYQAPYKAEDNTEHNPKLPEKEPNIYEEKADTHNEITAYKEFLKVVDLFESSTMPLKIPNCIIKTDHFKFKKISKFEEKHGHVEDYVKKSVKHVDDEEKVMIAVEHAVESNADDVEI